jgi:GAF domain-containing protein
VGHAAAAILEPDQLIRQVVELIRERFGLYYVGLFLVDETGEWAVLRATSEAGTGDAGQSMLRRGHRIRVGEGMIGWSVSHAEARIALDVGADAVRLASAELPNTRSEAALPLRSRGQVLGALTVQSDQPAAFDQDTMVVLQTMADQVAVALDNARLFAEGQAALETARRAYGELSRGAWAEMLRARPDSSYRSDETGVAKTEAVWRPEMEQALREGRTVQGNGGDAAERLPLAIPIKVRDQVVGVLDTYKPGAAGAWTQKEVTLLEAITEQVGVALESARLYQDSQRRAARERLIGEVTGRMRETLDLESVLATAAQEIRQALDLPEVMIRLSPAATDRVK